MLARLVSREHALSLVDQALVSGTNFLTTLAVARWAGSDQLGLYALGLSFLVSALAFQDSLILQPYQIQQHGGSGSDKAQAGDTLILSILFSTATTAVLAAGALGFLLGGSQSALVMVTWAIAATIPFGLMRDFARRFCFAHLRFGSAVALNGAVAAVQLSSLLWLALSGNLSALSACAVLGGSSALVVAAWLYGARAEFTICLTTVGQAVKQTWSLGKWLLAGRLTAQVQGYITYWIALAIAGTSMTGVYAASASVVGFANPLLLGLGNVLMPKSVLAWKTGGGAGLRREAWRNTVLIAALLAPFCLAAALLGEPVMRVLYHGAEFHDQGPVVTLLALAMLVAALGMPASNALAAMERPGGIVKASVLAAVVTIVMVWLLMAKWGLIGAAAGSVIGCAVGLVGRWVAFYVRIADICDPQAALRAVRTFTKSADDWTIARLGEGMHAEAFLLTPKHASSAPSERAIVAKIFKPAAAMTVETVQAQFDTLAELHAALDARTFNGWTIAVPRPLFVSTAALALMMTPVSGKPIEAWCGRGGPNAETWHGAVHAFAAAMRHCWSSGLRHGDLALQNVLFDFDNKTIALIDAGTPDSCLICNGGDHHDSALAELGHLVSDIATDDVALMRSAATRSARKMCVETVLRAHFAACGARLDQRAFVANLRHVAACHLADSIKPGRSPTGIWHGYVMRAASRRIDLILDQATIALADEARGEIPLRCGQRAA